MDKDEKERSENTSLIYIQNVDRLLRCLRSPYVLRHSRIYLGNYRLTFLSDFPSACNSVLEFYFASDNRRFLDSSFNLRYCHFICKNDKFR